jgi:hypothetical protein
MHRKEKCNKSIVGLTQYLKKNILTIESETDEQHMINGIVP